MKSDPGTVHLDIASRLDLLETVQTVLAQLTALVGFSDDQNHYMSVAVRESVANAIKHGNKNDDNKRVTVDFTAVPGQLTVEITDEGPGFDPDSVPDPLAPENLLKADGRGIFFMRQFMDEVSYAFPARGGTIVRMVKKA
ncbi:MAG: ATP-binding protein [Vicinamibacteria bacterium]|nr:ATP-binding protein [Vicinamibacteria bacterium]